MTEAWDRLWATFVSTVERLNETTRPEAHGLCSQLERGANDVFPLRALVRYSPRAMPGNEQLVISVDFARQGANVAGRADLARGDGLVLADGEILPPVLENMLADSSAALVEAERALADFVERQRDALLSEFQRLS